MTTTPPIQPKTRKPIVWWKAGLLGGTIWITGYFLITVFLVIFGLIELEDNEDNSVMKGFELIITALPLAFLIYLIAKQNDTKTQLYKAMGATIVAVSIFQIPLLLLLIFADLHIEASNPMVEIINLYLALYGISLLLTLGIVMITFTWPKISNTLYRNRETQD